MRKPMDSIVALARLTLSSADASAANRLLDEVVAWPTWLEQIEAHGLSGLASKHIGEHDLDIPAEIKLSLRALNIRHRAAAQARYSVLKEIDTVFKQYDLPYVALKGAALMPHLYLEESLRPMRDMDLLVPKERINEAGGLLRDIGFEMPDHQPSKFMRDRHQLPNATKTINGFTCSVELHLDSISREIPGHLYYPTQENAFQTISWNDLSFNAFEDTLFLHQVTSHLQGLHPGALLKLINVVDVVAFAERILHKGDWDALQQQYPNVINALRCLHLYTPLPLSLQEKLTPMPVKAVNGVGESMGSLRSTLMTKRAMSDRLRLLLLPSDWWLHLYYNVDPDKSLTWVKCIKHPLRVLKWLGRRFYSRLHGG